MVEKEFENYKKAMKEINAKLEEKLKKWPKRPIRVGTLNQLEKIITRKPHLPIHPLFMVEGYVSVETLSLNSPYLGGGQEYRKLMSEQADTLLRYDGRLKFWRYFPHMYVVESSDKKFSLSINSSGEWTKMKGYVCSDIVGFFECLAEFRIGLGKNR